MHIKVNWLNEEKMPKFHFLLLWLLIRSSPASSIDPKRFYQPGNVTLGVLLPLHVRTAQDKCGEFDAFGLGYTEAITFAIKRINEDPELLPNVTLGFDIRDYCDTPVLAMKMANDFVKSNYLNELLQEQGVKELRSKLTINMDYLTAPVSAVIGTGDSGSTTLVSSLLHVAAIPTISPFATSEELSSPYFNSFFRTIPPDGQQAKAMVDIIEYYQWKYIAAVAVDHSYGRYGLRALEREAYDRKTFCIAFSEYITPSGYKGKIITSIVRKLKDAENIKVVVLWSTYAPAKRFLEEATAQGLEGRTFLISEALTSMNPDVLGKNAVILKGAIGIRPYLFTDRLFEDYLKGIALNKTRESANPWWKEFWTSHLNCTSTSEGSCLNRSKIDARAFAKLHDAFVPYLTDAVYALAHALDSLPKCKEPGSGPLASGYCPEQNANIKHEAMLLKLRKVSFQGITGQVQFTESGDPTFSSYDIVNFQKQAENYENVKVGTWTGGTRINLTINDKQIIWANEESEPPISTCSHRCPPGTKQTITVSCCWECIKCPLGSISKQHSSPNCTKCPQLHKSNAGGTACLPLPVINIKWSDGTAVVFLILTVIGLLVTSVAFFIFMKNQSTPLVRASNRELSLLLLVAVALCFVLTLLHLAQPTKMLCCIVYPLRYFINTTFVSILFLKTNRLVRAFQTDIIPNWFKRYILDRKRQFLVVLGLNIVEVILAVLWLTLDPPYEHQEIRVQTHVFYTCMPFRSAVGRILRATMFSYFIFLSLVCAGYAFKARRLPENFNETRYIGLALYVLLISWMSFFPVDTSVEGFYKTIVTCATALVTAYGILLCVFAPKLFVILLHPEQNTNEFMKHEIGQFTRSSTFSGRIQRAKVQPTNGIKNNCT